LGTENDAGREASRPPTINDLKKVCEQLNKAAVKYVLVGGLAVNYYGFPRSTQDIDFLVEDTNENIEKIRLALSFLPDKASLEVQPDDVRNYTVVRIADEIVIDLIGKIGDLHYSNTGVELYNLDGVQIPIADLQTLIQSKQGVREKDRTDLQFLLLLKEKEEKIP
jgi:predicted nucleotidyltransferase